MEFNSIEDIFRLFSEDNATIIRQLQQWGLLRSTFRCPNRRCRRYCTLVVRRGVVLGHSFICRNCRGQHSILKGSFFEEIRISVKRVVYFIYFWASLTPPGVVSRLINMRISTVCQQYRFFRDISSWKLIQESEQFYLGGPGHIIQIDESVITKRKYNVGRVIPQIWILGIADVTSKKGVVVYIQNRSRTVILEEILKYVKPGSEIWTDKWRAYECLNTLDGVSPYVHKSVNHSRNFVDPETGVNTNYIEGYWSRLKGFCRRLHVMNSKLLPEHIDHFMWYQIYGGPTAQVFQNFITHITEKYVF